MDDECDPITDDELLYRRIPVSQGWYDSEKKLSPSPKAFRPNEVRDKTGLSVFRAKYVTMTELTQNPSGKQYYIAVLRAGDLREHGIDVIPKPNPSSLPGHAELPSLRADNRKNDDAEETQLLLAQKLCLRVEGPYPVCQETPRQIE